MRLLIAVDNCSNYPTADTLNNVTVPKLVKFLEKYIYNGGVLRSIELDQVKF